MSRFTVIICLSFLFYTLQAQGPVSGFMPSRKHTDLAIVGGQEQYQRYAFGAQIQDLETRISFINLFIEHGISDSLSLVLTVPYLDIANGGMGVQDGQLFVKFRNKVIPGQVGDLNFITAGGIAFPVSNYRTMIERPIGERPFIFQGRFILQYQFYFGGFLHLQSGINFKVVPQSQGAVPVLLRGGFGTSRYFFEVWSEFFKTFNSGTDERIFGGSGSNWWKVGGSIFIPVSDQFGLNAGGSYFLKGRNIGLSTSIFAGIIWRKDWKKGDKG